MRARKKNAFWTFCFSFVPGCAEMYWGFMQAGMSLLLPFVGLIFLTYLLEMPELMFVDLPVYIYAFFHARNMAHMSNEEVMQMDDRRVNMLDGIGISLGKIQKNRLAKWGGILMIVFGVYKFFELIYRNVPFSYSVVFGQFLHTFPQLVAAGVLIILGVKLISGKKKEMDMELNGGEDDEQQ